MSITPDATPPRSIMDWPAILSGAAIAAGAMVVFTGFTAAIGLGSVSAEPGEGLGTFASILVGLFAFLSTLASYALGGYVAGRMRTPATATASPTTVTADETRARDGVHGLAPVGGGPDHLETGLGREEGLQGLQHQRLVVHDKHSAISHSHSLFFDVPQSATRHIRQKSQMVWTKVDRSVRLTLAKWNVPGQHTPLAAGRSLPPPRPPPPDPVLFS